MTRITLIFILLSIISFDLEAQSKWDIVKQTDDITVFTRKSENSKYKEVKITMTIKCTMNELVAALEDVDAHKDWVPYTIDSKMVKKDSDSEFYYYVSSDFPFPAKDRDVVIYYEREQAADSKVVITRSEAAPEVLPKSDGFVRVPVFSSTYVLTPLDDGIIDIEYLLKVSPGGKIPAWIINLGVTKGPIKTMESLIKLIDSGKYSNYDVEGVDN